MFYNIGDNATKKQLTDYIVDQTSIIPLSVHMFCTPLGDFRGFAMVRFKSEEDIINVHSKINGKIFNNGRIELEPTEGKELEQ